MSDFIVLGYIPGTNFQIGMVGWLLIFAAVSACLYIVHRERRAQTIRFLLIRISITCNQYLQRRA